MTDTQLDKKLYQAIKNSSKNRNIKLSAEHDLYKKADPYFFNTSYYVGKKDEETIDIHLNFSVKYHRFDELQYGIINPGDPLRFTDKIRANSGAMCRVSISEKIQKFEFDGAEEALPGLSEDILDFIEKYYNDFLTMVDANYGDLGAYFIANMDNNPRLAGLAYLDRGDIQGVIACFTHPNMDEQNQMWSVKIQTDEQRRRAQENGARIFHSENVESILRNRKNQFAEYAIALQNKLEWTRDRAMYGLLSEECGK